SQWKSSPVNCGKNVSDFEINSSARHYSFITVAAMCDNHLVIQKAERNNRTVTTIKQLDNDDKTHELAKMITGNELTNAALEHAEQLLEMTDTYKEAVSS